MKSLFSFVYQFLIQLFSSFRLLNLFLITLTQILTCIFLLKESLCISNLFSRNDFIFCLDFYFLVFATVLSAAAGYILNDSCDRKIDLINSPKRGLFTEKNLSFLHFLSSLFFAIALFIGFVISLKVGFCVLLSIILLIFYAKSSKRIGILKPVIVSFLTAFSIGLVGLLNSSNLQKPFVSTTIYFFSIWAFLLSMLREIIKDFEDLEGDISHNSFTSVVHLGKQKSILVLNLISVLLILSILSSMFFSVTNYATFIHKLVMIILIGIFIYLLNNHKYISYKKLSLFCKIMMLIGIVGMIAY